MSLASTMFNVAGVMEIRDENYDNSWRRCRTPSPENSQRYGDDNESSWRRCRTPSPDFSYRGRFIHIDNNMSGSSDAVVNPSYQNNLYAATPPFVLVYMPIIEGAPTGLVDYDYVPIINGAPTVEYESQKGGASTPSTGATSGTESPRNFEDTDREEHPSAEEGLEINHDDTPTSNECVDPDESLCWILLNSDCSLGSVGHPYACADACKYLRKSKGCKDGPSCPRCHFCRWVAPRHAYRERTRVRQRLRRKVASESNHERQPVSHD